MKLLIAYDGARCGDTVLEDLKNAGLPDELEALVVTVAEVWVLEQPEVPADPAQEIESMLEGAQISNYARSLIKEADSLALDAVDRIERGSPGWKVGRRVVCDSPAWGILQTADTWKPDLIVVGTHGRGAIGRVLLGSVSQKVLTEAHCSVRIAREAQAIDGTPLRILIGADGTPDSEAAINTVASRSWPEGSSALVVSAIGELPIPPAYLAGDVAHWVDDSRADEQLERVTADAVLRLKEAGLNADFMIKNGAPSSVLLDVAHNWGADAIFLGARGHRFLDRFLLGSVSSSVATKAKCTVEIVRKKEPDDG